VDRWGDDDVALYVEEQYERKQDEGEDKGG